MDIKREKTDSSASAVSPEKNENRISSQLLAEVSKEAEAEARVFLGKEEKHYEISGVREADLDRVMPSLPNSFHVKEELDPVFICDLCGLTTDDEEELKDHIVSAHVAITTAKRSSETTNARTNGNVDGDNSSGGVDDDDESSVESGDVMCESCGRCFARQSDFKRHFKAKHFVETIVVPKMLEIPAQASTSLRRKVETLAEDMAERRQKHNQCCTFKQHSSRCLGRTVTDDMRSSLRDIGRMMKQEFPAYKCGKERKEMAAYIAFRLQCGTDQLKRYLSGRWNNPLPIDPLNIHAMRERLKQAVTTAMPDVIANHKSKTQRLSGRAVAPVQSFKWSISTKQTFKELVDMHLQNMRFDVDVRFDADEKEMKARVEFYLGKLIKTLVSIWPAGWMSERVLMNDCRSASREFLKSLKEKQSEFYEDVYADEDCIPGGSPFIDPEDLKEEEDCCEQVLLESTSDGSDLASSSSSSSSSSSPADVEGAADSIDRGRTKFVWARRVTLVKGYGRQLRMCLLPLVDGNHWTSKKASKANYVFNGTKREPSDEPALDDESKRPKVEISDEPKWKFPTQSGNFR